MATQEIKWINTVRALCMMSVYLLHSEIYYGIARVSYGYALTPFYVNAFFFVIGYLLFKKYTPNDGTGTPSSKTDFDRSTYIKALSNVFYRLILPTILFSTLIYVPKMIFHTADLSIVRYLHEVLGGISYWFTSTLSVAQIILLTLFLTRRSSPWFYLIVSAVGFAIGMELYRRNSYPFPWYYQTGLTSMLLMTLGGVYQRYETRINPILKTTGAIMAFLVYLVCLFLTWNTQTLACMPPIEVNLSGAAAILCSIVSVIALGHILPRFKILEYIGRHSIVFYFFSGAMPALICKIALHFFPDPSYVITLTVAFISLCMSAVISLVIQRKCPFLLDLRRIKKGLKR
ncbi:MAG: acyltransferase [Paraprevotella sp.]|nr:acyltransferase [Paraprevotella sp.]